MGSIEESEASSALVPVSMETVTDVTRAAAWKFQKSATVTRAIQPRIPSLESTDLAREVVSEVLSQSMSTPIPLSARLPFNYRKLPTWLRNAVARRAVSGWVESQTGAAAPRWPVDATVDYFADLLEPKPAYLSGPTPVVISHDLDTPEGLTNYLEFFLPTEMSLGVTRPAAFVVPTWWPTGGGPAEELCANTETGIHGFDHSGHTPFAEPKELRSRVAFGVDLASRIGARGYRAPSLLRSRPLLSELAEHYSFDSSIPSSGGPLPTRNSGAATVRPFLMGQLVEVPVTLPRDGSLLFLGTSWPEIAQTWRESARMVREAHGVVVLLIHCEERFSGSAQGRKVVESFVSWLAESDEFEFTTFEHIVREARAWSGTPRISL
jgi:hypothetical protein